MAKTSSPCSSCTPPSLPLNCDLSRTGALRVEASGAGADGTSDVETASLVTGTADGRYTAGQDLSALHRVTCSHNP